MLNSDMKGTVLKKFQNNNQKGFSLVELIIVIAIMAVLVGVLAPQFVRQVEKSRESKDIQTIENLQEAVSVYVAAYRMEPGNEITITIENRKATVGGSAYAANGLKEYGVEDANDLASSKWEDNVFRYNLSTGVYHWEADNDITTTGADYYYYDGNPR